MRIIYYGTKKSNFLPDFLCLSSLTFQVHESYRVDIGLTFWISSKKFSILQHLDLSCITILVVNCTQRCVIVYEIENRTQELILRSRSWDSPPPSATKVPPTTKLLILAIRIDNVKIECTYLLYESPCHTKVRNLGVHIVSKFWVVCLKDVKTVSWKIWSCITLSRSAPIHWSTLLRKPDPCAPRSD